MLGRRIADLGDHDLARSGALVIAWSDQDVLMHATVVRCDQGQAVLDDDPPDQARRAPLEHFDDRALATTAPVHADDTAKHAIAMQDGAHLRRRQVQVVTALVGLEESVAFGVGQYDAGNQVEFLGDAVATAAVLQQLAIADHRRQALGQRIDVLFAAQTQRGGDRLGLQQGGLLGEQAHDRFAARNRALVALGFALGKRIVRPWRPR